MERKKILITVITYPLPSRSYDELVCTAGVLENGEWIRIYPVPLSFLTNQKKSGHFKSYKYSWIELDLEKRKDDFRPESYSPVHYDFHDLKELGRIDPHRNWEERKKYCLKKVYTSKAGLLKDSLEPNNMSLAAFKPAELISLDIEEDSREWKDEWMELKKQGDLFWANSDPENIIPKLS